MPSFQTLNLAGHHSVRWAQKQRALFVDRRGEGATSVVKLPNTSMSFDDRRMVITFRSNGAAKLVVDCKGTAVYEPLKEALLSSYDFDDLVSLRVTT